MQQTKHMITADSRDICEEVFRLATVADPDQAAIHRLNARLVRAAVRRTPKILATESIRRRGVYTAIHLETLASEIEAEHTRRGAAA